MCEQKTNWSVIGIAMVIILLLVGLVTYIHVDIEDKQKFCQINGWDYYSMGYCYKAVPSNSGLGTYVKESGYVGDQYREWSGAKNE